MYMYYVYTYMHYMYALSLLARPPQEASRMHKQQVAVLSEMLHVARNPRPIARRAVSWSSRQGVLSHHSCHILPFQPIL